MAKKKTVGPPSTRTDNNPAPPGRRAPARRADAAVSPLSGGEATTSEEVQLAVAHDTGSVGGAGGGPRQPSYEEIADAAYRRYLDRGGAHGQDFDDWLQADRELQRRKT